MKKLTKKLAAALLTAMMIATAQMLAFATVGTTSENVSGLASERVSQHESALVSGQESMIQPYNTTGNVNASPNTGVPIAPLAVALLAASAVPVIIKTRKK